MTEKWKEFLTITELTTAVPVEAAWTTFLVCASSKIPYIGIPIAAWLGIVGTISTVWLGNGCRFAYKDWYKEYCTV